MRSWKTTASASLSAFASFIIFSQELHYVTWPPVVLALAMFASVGGLAAFGMSAKDHNVTGGDIKPMTTTAVIEQEGSPTTVIHSTQKTKES